MTTETTSRDFFERKYLQDADPWNFASDTYELHRYDAIVNALVERRYERAFEPGCSVGVLTARLAGLCTFVDALDISPAAVELARARCSHLPNVRFACGTVTDNLPSHGFDLLVFSEIGYYFEQAELRLLADALVERLTDGGILVAAHWLGNSVDHILSGDCVHEVLHTLDGLTLQHSEREPGFRLDRWMKTPERAT